MKNIANVAATIFISCLLTTQAIAEEFVVKTTQYLTWIDQGDVMVEENDTKFLLGSVYRGVAETLEGTASVTCSEQGHLGNNNNWSGAGLCTYMFEQGDLLWTWFKPEGEGKSSWGAIGGTGRFKGATGSGTTQFVKSLPGNASMSQATGKIVTP